MRYEDERRAYDHYRSAERYARHGNDAKAHAHVARAVHYYGGPSMFGRTFGVSHNNNKGIKAPTGPDSFDITVSDGTGGSQVTATVRDRPVVAIILFVLDGAGDNLTPGGGPFSDPLGLALLDGGTIANGESQMIALKAAMSSRASGSRFVCVRLMNTTRDYTFDKLMDLMRVTLEYLVKKGAISLESTVALIPQSYQIDTVSKPLEFLANLQKYSFFKPVPLQDSVSSVIVMVATVRMFFPVVTFGPSHPSRPSAVPTITKTKK